MLAKSGSESSISETCDSVKGAKKSYESERNEIENVDKTEDVTIKEALEVPKANMGKRGSLTSAKSLHELKHEASSSKKDDHDVMKKASSVDKEVKGIRPSKSDTSLTETFVVIDNEYNKRKCQNFLREGMPLSNSNPLHSFKEESLRSYFIYFFCPLRFHMASTISVPVKINNAHRVRSKR